MCFCADAGYGFVDFDSEQAAELALKALKAEGMQAQMARVCYLLASYNFTYSLLTPCRVTAPDLRCCGLFHIW